MRSLSMNEPRDFLRRLVDLLDEAGIPYMVAGSLGSSLHGRPRATNDVDLVIDPTESQFHQFLNSVGPDYYISKEAAWAALRARSAFNVIDIKTGSRPMSQRDVDENGQLTTYALLHKSLFGKYPRDVRIINLVRGTTPSHQVLHTHRAKKDVDALLDRYVAFHEGILAGSFDPTPSWKCSWCQFKATCEFARQPRGFY